MARFQLQSIIEKRIQSVSLCQYHGGIAVKDDKPTVYVLDDDLSIRKALDRLLASKGFRVECFGTAEQFLQTEVYAPVSCLLLDIGLPGVSGLDLQVLLSQKRIMLPIIFITGHADIPTAVHAIKAGAVSFLTKPFGEVELMREIENAFAICRDQIQKRSEVADIQRCYDTLTKRETEILSFVVNGRLNKQTAFELGIVENTVKVHRRRVMKKMQAQSLAELVMMIQKLNLAPQTQRLAGR